MLCTFNKQEKSFWYKKLDSLRKGNRKEERVYCSYGGYARPSQVEWHLNGIYLLRKAMTSFSKDIMQQICGHTKVKKEIYH